MDSRHYLFSLCAPLLIYACGYQCVSLSVCVCVCQSHGLCCRCIRAFMRYMNHYFIYIIKEENDHSSVPMSNTTPPIHSLTHSLIHSLTPSLVGFYANLMAVHGYWERTWQHEGIMRLQLPSPHSTNGTWLHTQVVDSLAHRCGVTLSFLKRITPVEAKCSTHLHRVYTSTHQRSHIRMYTRIRKRTNGDEHVINTHFPSL